MSAPAQFVADSWQSAEFYGNKIMMEFKGKDDVQLAWVKALKVCVLNVMGRKEYCFARVAGDWGRCVWSLG